MLNVDRWDPFTLDFWIRDNARNPLPVVVLQRTFGTDVGYNGFDLMLTDGMLELRFYRVWPGNAIGVRAAEADRSRRMAARRRDVRWFEHSACGCGFF